MCSYQGIASPGEIADNLCLNSLKIATRRSHFADKKRSTISHMRSHPRGSRWIALIGGVDYDGVLEACL